MSINLIDKATQYSEQQRVKQAAQTQPTLADLKLGIARQKVRELLVELTLISFLLKKTKTPISTIVDKKHRGWIIYRITHSSTDEAGWSPSVTHVTSFGLVLLEGGDIIEVEFTASGNDQYVRPYNYSQELLPGFIYPKITPPLSYAYLFQPSVNYEAILSGQGQRWFYYGDTTAQRQAYYACAFADTLEQQLLEFISEHQLVK